MSGHLRTLDGQEHPIGDKLPPVDCFRCGICCARYQPPIDPEEAKAIAGGMGMSAQDFLAKYAQLTYVGYLLRQEKGACVFLSWKEGGSRATCTIHPFRPQACRNWVASLARRECQEGLTRLKPGSKIMLVREVYPSNEEADRFSRQVSTDEENA